MIYNTIGGLFMDSLLRRRRPWHVSFYSSFLGVFVVLTLLLTACGGDTSNDATPDKAVIPAPKGLIQAGTLTVGSDTTYPPQEFFDPAQNKATGFDIDLITEIAKLMGLKVEVKKANFDIILDDLSAKRYDVVISALTINDDRKMKADLIPYFNAGQSLLVQKGNPLKIGGVNDLCGKKVGVQNGTVEADTLSELNKKECASKQVQVTSLKDQTDVIQLLVDKRVDATFQDSPVTDYYLKQNPGQFEVAGQIIEQAVEGIAVRKGDKEMYDAIKSGLDMLKKNGTYDKLFEQWGLNPVQKVSDVEQRRQLA